MNSKVKESKNNDNNLSDTKGLNFVHKKIVSEKDKNENQPCDSLSWYKTLRETKSKSEKTFNQKEKSIEKIKKSNNNRDRSNMKKSSTSVPLIELSESSDDLEVLPSTKETIATVKKRKFLEPLEYICTDEIICCDPKPNILLDYPTLSKEIQEANLHQLNIKRGIRRQSFSDTNISVHIKEDIAKILSDKELDNLNKSIKLNKLFYDHKGNSEKLIISSILEQMILFNIEEQDGLELLNLLEFCKSDSKIFLDCVKKLLSNRACSDEQRAITCKLIANLYKMACNNKYCFLDGIQKYCVDKLNDWIDIKDNDEFNQINYVYNIKCVKDFLENCLFVFRDKDYNTCDMIRNRCKTYAMNTTLNTEIRLLNIQIINVYASGFMKKKESTQKSDESNECRVFIVNNKEQVSPFLNQIYKYRNEID
jgi:hypothetical protein